MIVYGSGRVEAPSVETVVPQLVDLLWRRSVAEDQIEGVMNTYRDQIAVLENRVGKLKENISEQGYEALSLAQRLEEAEARAVEAEQDRDSWRSAHQVVVEELQALRKAGNG